MLVLLIYCAVHENRDYDLFIFVCPAQSMEEEIQGKSLFVVFIIGPDFPLLIYQKVPKFVKETRYSGRVGLDPGNDWAKAFLSIMFLFWFIGLGMAVQSHSPQRDVRESLLRGIMKKTAF
jgi:hypothetical protein